MLVCFPMRVDWELAGAGMQQERETAFPAPEISSRDGGEPPTWPGPVEMLAREGSAAGWRVRKQWARGCLPHASLGTPGASQDFYAVRFLRPGWGAWAVRRGNSWAFVWMWGETLAPFGLGNVTDLRAWLAGPTADAAFFDAIRKRLADQEERKRLLALCDKGQHSDLAPGLGPLSWQVCGVCGNDAGWKKIKKGKTGEGL